MNFIDFMIKSGVLRFGEFKTKSGRLSPYFVNTGNYCMGSQLATLGKCYASMIETACDNRYTAIYGPAYKGIPLASAAAMALYTEHGKDKPYFFNRKEAKDHGEGGSLIGYQPEKGDKIIIVEDVITAGTAVRESMAILKQYEVEVTDMFISVNRCEKGYNGKTAVAEVMDEFGIKVHSLITVKDILAYMENAGMPETEKLKAYMEQYCIL